MNIKKTLLIFEVAILVMVVQLAVYRSKVNAQSDPGRVGLVIQFLDGRIEKKCIQITKDPFSSFDALLASGYAITADYSGSLGAAVCKIDQDGCSADDCFCEPSNYWSFWHLGEDNHSEPAWIYSNAGSTNNILHPGEVDGWRYGGGVSPSEKPDFEEICQSAASTPTSTAQHFSASPTWTAGPAANGSRPTSRPTAWATAIIIGQPLATDSAPTPVSSLFASATPLPLQLSPTAPTELQSIQAGPTEPVPAPEGSLPAAVEPQVSVEPESAAASFQTPATFEPKPNKKPAASNQQIAALQKSAANPTLVAGGPPVRDGGNNQTSSTASRRPKWILLLGGLAGFGSFMGFFCLLIGGLGAIYFLRRK